MPLAHIWFQPSYADSLVAASTFFVWDYILTIPLELDLVWRSKWNALKFIYLVQRYLPFVDTVGLVLYREWLPLRSYVPSSRLFSTDQLTVQLTDAECRRIYITSGCLYPCIYFSNANVLISVDQAYLL